MTDLVIAGSTAKTPSLAHTAPQLRLALADRQFRFGGEPPWDAEWAIEMAARAGGEGEVATSLATLEAAAAPAPPAWFGKRLTMLWTMFMLGRAVDEAAKTGWMVEVKRLLADLPHDIVAHAIDEAIRTSRHGFMPTVGEIRGVADPLAAERRQQIDRLGQMVAALNDPVATAARADRSDEQRRRLAASN